MLGFWAHENIFACLYQIWRKLFKDIKIYSWSYLFNNSKYQKRHQSGCFFVERAPLKFKHLFPLFCHIPLFTHLPCVFFEMLLHSLIWWKREKVHHVLRELSHQGAVRRSIFSHEIGSDVLLMMLRAMAKSGRRKVRSIPTTKRAFSAAAVRTHQSLTFWPWKCHLISDKSECARSSSPASWKRIKCLSIHISQLAFSRAKYADGNSWWLGYIFLVEILKIWSFYLTSSF